MTVFGIPRSPRVLLAIPAAVLTGLAFAAPIMAYAVTLKKSSTFNVLYRFGITPMFLFSGVFFPVTHLPEWLRSVAWFTPLFHGVELVRGLTLDSLRRRWMIHVRFLCIVGAGIGAASPCGRFVGGCTHEHLSRSSCRRRGDRCRMVQRNLLVYKHTWMVIFSGFFEPLFYLLGIGIGVGSMVRADRRRQLHRVRRAWTAGVELHERRNHGRVLQHLLQAALSEDLRRHPRDADAGAGCGFRRDAVGADARFSVCRGVPDRAARARRSDRAAPALSPWAVLAWPAAVLAAASFSAMALCLTSFARKVQDFDMVMGLLVMPMFLFSGIFVPIERFPAPVQWIMQATPLYHAVSLLRQLTTGAIDLGIVGHLAYLVTGGATRSRRDAPTGASAGQIGTTKIHEDCEED